MRKVVKRKKYLGGLSKAEIGRRCREILYKYPIGISLDASDFVFMCKVLGLHLRAKEKVGVGIKRIYTCETMWKTRGFMIERLDGSLTDFSYIKCLRRPKKVESIKVACRNAIRRDISDFKGRAFVGVDTLMCPLTGKFFSKDKCHVDHYPVHFNDIFVLWIKSRSIDVDTVELNGSYDLCEQTFFVDKELEEDFRRFHSLCATLRVVSKEGHMQRRGNR